MRLLPGVYIATKKNGTIYYRSSITFRNKHISLGSYSEELIAHEAYKEASNILKNSSYEIEDHIEGVHNLSLHKWVVLINYRDNKMYFKNPIYIKNRYFYYYLSQSAILKFDVDDLFYYSTHKIMTRGGHLFVTDYGMQLNILSRYGIKNYAVAGRDYLFANGDNMDYCYGNIEIINKYHGVSKIMKKGIPSYIAKVHVNGDTIIGRYSTEIEAAIAYNKATSSLLSQGVKKDFYQNYISEINEIEYASIYHQVRLSKRIRKFTK